MTTTSCSDCRVPVFRYVWWNGLNLTQTIFMPLGYMFCELIDFPPLPSDWLAGGVPLLKKLLIMYIISIRKIKDFTVAHTPGLACSWNEEQYQRIKELSVWFYIIKGDTCISKWTSIGAWEWLYPESKNNYLTVVLPFNQQQIFKGLFKPHDEDAIEVKRNTEQVFPWRLNSFDNWMRCFKKKFHLGSFFMNMHGLVQ